MNALKVSFFKPFNPPKERPTLEKIEEENQNNLKNLRKHVGYIVLGAACAWLLFVVGLIVAQGLGKVSLGDKVLITLLTTTTANIFILLRVIIKSLYPDKNPS